MSIRSPLPLLLSALLLLAAIARADDRWAPNAVAGPVDQLDVSGNACGPAALLAAIRCGDGKWRAVAEKIPGRSDRSKLLYIIKAHGVRPSASLRGRNRWSRHGINAEDLADVAGELAGIGGLPAPRIENLLPGRRESVPNTLKRLHRRFRQSLINGLPPVISLRRYVLRHGAWVTLDSHFVTLVQVPEKLAGGEKQFTLTYFDPWGGKKRTATLREPVVPVLSPDGQRSGALEFFAPDADVGRDKARSGERTLLVPAIAIGRW
ncbi:hypothetical protein [Haloferula sargassicola]|uniref:Peptidase C39-like domain-containing protein n=1 Tax=Haloferula sargassicola TaxID=490096 RepID=A0ABP9UT17_9BACT